MYVMQPGLKRDPLRRWALPDRIFFGHGACQILAGVYLDSGPIAGFRAERIIPRDGRPGNHIYVTDGMIAFDYHGYSRRSRLLAHHARCWSRQHAGWACDVDPVDFDLLDSEALNLRRMLGPDQFPHDPVERACRFLGRIDHAGAADRARALA